MTTKALFWAGVLAIGLPGVAQAVTCRDMTFDAQSYTVCEVSPEEDLRLFLKGDDLPYGSFAAVDVALRARGKQLAFAMNAGMFHADLAPVGLYIENWIQSARLITSDGPGNFGLLPNGVFCAGVGFSVIESRAYAEARPPCRYASQSGPMLVIDGALHPRFVEGSDSLNYRNGVGVTEDGRALFAISNEVVNFHSFARLFRDALGTPNALFFDGSVSRLYAPMLERHDAGFPMGPMIGVVTDLTTEKD
ncbi:phosphodiester glycosidase family protein [Tabrizicola sp.]|uniref:phosphodiester glycosidase family protein n=1 Tax=Tabrizicola sp. TaxID=2005166 RepID=UPI003D26829D